MTQPTGKFISSRAMQNKHYPSSSSLLLSLPLPFSLYSSSSLIPSRLPCQHIESTSTLRKKDVFQHRILGEGRGRGSGGVAASARRSQTTLPMSTKELDGPLIHKASCFTEALLSPSQQTPSPHNRLPKIQSPHTPTPAHPHPPHTERTLRRQIRRRASKSGHSRGILVVLGVLGGSSGTCSCDEADKDEAGQR